MNVSASRFSTDQSKLAPLRERAESHLEQKAWDKCIADCRSLLEIDPRHHFAQETLATALLQNGQLDEATDAVKRLLEISPRDPLHRLRLATLFQMQTRHGDSLREFERIVAMYPDAPFSDDAREAIDNLDRLQTSQILLMAAEHDRFRWELERDVAGTIAEHGFQLSDNGFETLRQMIPGSEDETEVRAPKIH